MLLPSQDRAWLVRVALEQRADTDLGARTEGAMPTGHPLIVEAIARGGVLVAEISTTATGLGVLAPSDAGWSSPDELFAIALSSSGQLYAIVLLARSRPFSSPDVALAWRSVGQAAEELRIAASMSQSRARAIAEHAIRFQTFLSALAEARTVAQISTTAVELSPGVVAASGAALLLLDETRSRLDVAATHHLASNLARAGDCVPLSSDHPIARLVRRDDDVFLATPGAVAEALGTASPPIEGLCVLPLRTAGLTLGAVAFETPTHVASDGELRGVMRMMARNIARSIHRIELLEMERRARVRLEHLATVSASYASTLEYSATIENIRASFAPAFAEECLVQLDDGPPPRSELTLNLDVGGERLGRVHLTGLRTPLSSVDRVFVGELAHRAALALDAARLLVEREAAIRAREDFLAIAGHELKTPLTTLRVWIFALEKFAPDANVEVAMASRQLRRMEQLVERLLAVGRADQELSLSLELERVDLAALARDVAAQFDDVAVVGEGEAVVDRLQFALVLTNLIGNAVKYGDANPVTVTVGLDGSDAVVSVRDRGIGIPSEDRGRIFERFGRAVSSSHYAGLGLGLWIARRIIDQHQGSIAVESAVGDGSEFVVRIPRAPQDGHSP